MIFFSAYYILIIGLSKLALSLPSCKRAKDTRWQCARYNQIWIAVINQ